MAGDKWAASVPRQGMPTWELVLWIAFCHQFFGWLLWSVQTGLWADWLPFRQVLWVFSASRRFFLFQIVLQIGASGASRVRLVALSFGLALATLHPTLSRMPLRIFSRSSSILECFSLRRSSCSLQSRSRAGQQTCGANASSFTWPLESFHPDFTPFLTPQSILSRLLTTFTEKGKAIQAQTMQLTTAQSNSSSSEAYQVLPNTSS